MTQTCAAQKYRIRCLLLKEWDLVVTSAIVCTKPATYLLFFEKVTKSAFMKLRKDWTSISVWERIRIVFLKNNSVGVKNITSHSSTTQLKQNSYIKHSFGAAPTYKSPNPGQKDPVICACGHGKKKERFSRLQKPWNKSP